MDSGHTVTIHVQYSILLHHHDSFIIIELGGTTNAFYFLICITKKLIKYQFSYNTMGIINVVFYVQPRPVSLLVCLC